MNNVTFGDDDAGYYETVAGGAGAVSSTINIFKLTIKITVLHFRPITKKWSLTSRTFNSKIIKCREEYLEYLVIGTLVLWYFEYLGTLNSYAWNE